MSDRLPSVRSPEPPTLSMRSTRRDEIHVIALCGELDLTTSAEVDRELRRVEQTSTDAVAIDLRELTFIDSTGIRLTLQAQRRCARNGKPLMIVRGTTQVQRLFDICGVGDTMPFVDELPGELAEID